MRKFLSENMASGMAENMEREVRGMGKTGKKKQKRRRVGKPSRLFWGLARLVLAPWYYLHYGLRIDRSGLGDLKGPALVLAPHTSDRDHIVVGLTLAKQRPTFVMSEHFMAHPMMRPALKRMHVITKKMFCADVHTVMEILRAKNEGNVIVLFPEGRLPACGHSVQVADGTAELIQRLGIPVYVVTGNGAYLTFPKWAKRPRRGKIRVTTAKLFDGATVRGMRVEEIREQVSRAIRHDDEAAMAGVRYRTRDMTAGLDGILRLCPLCGAWGTLSTRHGHIRCACGLDATLDETYRLHGAPFERVNEWFDRQQARLDPARCVMESDMDVAAIDRHGNLKTNAGGGHAKMDAQHFSFRGQVFGEAVSFTIPTERIGGLPVTVADHFDLYHDNRLYQFFPKPDRRAAIDWVCYLDRLHALRASASDAAQGAPVGAAGTQLSTISTL
jgi:1-acyl-sn-glycerol-3-phosphate acyltransferase